MRGVIVGAFCWISSSFALEMGVVDMDTVMQSPKMKALVTQIQAKAETYQEKLVTLKKEYDNLKSEFEKNDMLMDESTRQTKQTQLQKKGKALETERNTLVALLEKEQSRILTHVQDIIVKFAQRNKLDLVMSHSNILYAGPNLDKTADVLKLIKDSRLS
jgi:Skp family chaperone for outer membrane proteins